MTTNKRKILEPLARFGYLAKGVVYLIIGIFALLAVFDAGGSVGGSRMALSKIASGPFGSVLLGLVGIGLLSYAGWRFIQAAFDTEDNGTDGKGIAKRLGYVFSGVLYLGLGVATMQSLFGSGGGESRRSYLADILQSDAGQVFVVIAGIFVVGVGLYQIQKGLQEKFKNDLKLNEMSREERKASIRVGKLGLIARGAVFPIIGYYLVRAGLSQNAGRAEGVGGVLRNISSQQFGSVMLFIIALGLAAYGIHMVFNSRYRRIHLPAPPTP